MALRKIKQSISALSIVKNLFFRVYYQAFFSDRERDIELGIRIFGSSKSLYILLKHINILKPITSKRRRESISF